ncbi:hypothetical protein K2173_007190 [Erythroxylum novogranatense]|uniref:Uncharacterized protein n=1 Tax=Erythroxylum novogranatense TaxID=1862640 RepID=A0AAV8SZZ0_9ROSI|nr:hypothetical protein K2173_007190 [Erythroxylum novogranatense]
MELTTTIQTVKAFVGRLECRFMISQAVIGSMCNRANIDHLLRDVAFPTQRDSSSKVSGRGVKSIKPGNREAQKPVKLSRYPIRVLLCAYMIIGHLDIVFSGQSECEIILAELAANFIQEFELLIKIIINGQIRCAKVDESFAGSDCRTFRKCQMSVAEVGCMHALSDMHSKASEKNHMHTKASDRHNSENLQKSLTHLSERNATSVTDRGLSLNLMLSENELLVNEIILEHQSRFADGLDVAREDHDSLKARVREMMKKAFWDGVLESMKNDEPDFSWVLKLMKEVRDELYEMSTQPWRKEISETIDVDILEEFTLISLRILSTPANYEAITVLHNKILRELGEVPLPGDESKVPYVLSIIKGPRFTLQEIQFGFLFKCYYLEMAFANCHGPPGATPSSLSMTKQWLLSCPKEPMSLLVRLDLPETLKLNVFRLRIVQLQIQKIIVISISLMVKNLVTSSADVEYLVSQCFEQLYKLLDGVEVVGLSDIIEKINGTQKGCNQLLDIEKVQDSRTIMANMLAKSLQAGDAVYTRVFGGTGLNRRRLVGAAILADRVIKAAEVLIVIASVSFSVHQEWYKVARENL